MQEGGSGAVFDVVSTSVLFLYLQGDDYCEFTFEWVTGKELEIKTALLVLISVIIMLIIPLVSSFTAPHLPSILSSSFFV